MGKHYDGYVCEHTPGEHGDGFAWRICRAAAAVPLKLVLLSDDWFGIRLHYWNRRSRPCTGPATCPVCRQQVSRWNGYLLAVRCSDESHVVWEFTPAIHDDLAAAREKYGTLRGLQVRITRKDKRENGRLQFSEYGQTPGLATLPPAQDIVPIIFRIWGLPCPDAGPDEQHAAARLRPDDKPHKPRKPRQASTGNSEPVNIVQDLPGQMRLLG